MIALRSTWRRKITNGIFTITTLVAIVIALSALIAIFFALFKMGLSGLKLSVFSQNTPPPLQSGGLKNAILGSLMINGVAILASVPIGILIATYLVEFGMKSRFSRIIRFINDTMLSAPSIVIGLFIYVLIVQAMGHFSGLAGSVALMLIAIPIIARATEDVLYLVSPTLRESAVALGVPRYRVVLSIIYVTAKQGIITGTLLALARTMGETAPLLFTTLSNQFLSFDLTKPMANLPVVIYRFAMSPYAGWQQLAWTGALLIAVVVLGINLLARLIFKAE